MSSEDIMEGLGFIIVVACFTMFGIVGLESLLRPPRLAPVRRAFSASRHRWLAVLLPFSPAVSVALALRYGLPALIGRWTSLLVLGMIVSTYCAAVFSGWWLSLPRDSERPMRGWLAIFLGSIFCFGGEFLMFAVLGGLI